MSDTPITVLPAKTQADKVEDTLHELAGDGTRVVAVEVFDHPAAEYVDDCAPYGGDRGPGILGAWLLGQPSDVYEQISAAGWEDYSEQYAAGFEASDAAAGLSCDDTDPEHVHDDGECCECGSRAHCCAACPVFQPAPRPTYPRKWRISFDPTYSDPTVPWVVNAGRMTDEDIALSHIAGLGGPYYMGDPDSIVEQISGGSFAKFEGALAAVVEAQTKECAAKRGGLTP